MSVRAVEYFQAVCDLCGAVDDGGEFSAWSDDESAIAAAEDADWIELETSPSVPRGTYLVCNAHRGDGLEWCAECEADLDLRAWKREGDGLVQQCTDGHASQIALAVDVPRTDEAARAALSEAWEAGAAAAWDVGVERARRLSGSICAKPAGYVPLSVRRRNPFRSEGAS